MNRAVETSPQYERKVMHMNKQTVKQIVYQVDCVMILVFLMCSISVSALAGQPEPQPVVPAREVALTRNRFLLLDSRIVENVENARLTLGTVQKHKANPLFVEDKPWEKRFDNLYGNVIYDKEEKIYKCWYNLFIIDASAKGMTLEQRDTEKYKPPPREIAICYATSKDGIKWNKPELGLVDYEGSKKNNIIWRGPHGAGIFKDYRDPDPARRYKMIFAGKAPPDMGKKGFRYTLFSSHSADGINWSPKKTLEDVDGSVIGYHRAPKGLGQEVKGDTHNNALWAPTLKKYVGITRTLGKKGREVTRLESSDFEQWKSTGVVLESRKGGSRPHVPDGPSQPYAMPVFYHGGVYIGLVALFDGPEDRTRTGLAWSPDTKEWHIIEHDKELIPRSETKLDYDYGCIFACASPVFMEDEIRLYYGGSDYKHSTWRTGNLSLATLRPDGFAGYEQESKDKPAIITTTAIPYAGQKIRVTADVDDGGSIKVSIVDDKGQDLVNAGLVSETMTDGPIRLKKSRANKIRLKFEINNAKLYSFAFEK